MCSSGAATIRTILWFRGKDLRLADHEPLRAARGDEVIPLFVLDPYFFAPKRARELPHRMQFLLESLVALEAAIRAKGSRLILVAGKSIDVVPALAKEWRADRVVAQRWVEPFARERDRRIAGATKLELFEGETLLPPGVLRTKAGRPYAVYSQFARAFHDAAHIAKPWPVPRELPPVPRGIRSSARIPTLKQLGIEHNAQIVAGGEVAARARLQRFVRIADSYATDRDRMDLAGTSRLSQDLKFGTLSPRTVWNAITNTTFRRELIWREFMYSTLWDRPDVLEAPFQPAWRRFPYRKDARAWKAWVDGTTGYPIVDAAARQLLAEGFVHNRARMVAASFLTKHLLIDYRRGEAHYMKYLTDGDWAQNNGNWQWAAGCGCDAQPWFRIFNPTTQAEKFDPDGDYVRRWVPEIGTPKYPRPIVDHAAARQRFLATAKAHLKRG